MAVVRKAAPLLGGLGVGLLIGLLGAFVQAHRSILIFSDRYLVIPWGVLIVLGVLIASIRGVALASSSRAAAWLVVAGWIVVTILLASETAGGDIAVSSGARQWAYLLGGAILGSAAATLPARPLRSNWPDPSNSAKPANSANPSSEQETPSI